MTQHSKTKPCQSCGTPISTESQSLDFGERTWTFPAPTKCEQCYEVDRIEEEEREKIQQLEKAWAKIAPPRYQHSDITRFPDKLQTAIAAFNPNKNLDSGIGIGIRGESGLCKSRAAYQLLKSALKAGHRVASARATEIATLAANQWDDRPASSNSVIHDLMTIGQANQKRLSDFGKVHWLLIDDIAKEKTTDRAEAALYDILEERTSNALPTIWTLNMSAGELKRKLSKDRSTPILRRLVEFSEIISL